jgi:hypothetical protein
MTKIQDYQTHLRSLTDWVPYLLRESRLPGPRGNLELAQAVAEEGDEALFFRLAAYDAGRSPANSPEEFLAFCGVLGLGKLLVEGHPDVPGMLRQHASDPRWRTREAVAMALQRLGKHDMQGLLQMVQPWIEGGPLEKRAVAAALCEPALLHNRTLAAEVLRVLDTITTSIKEMSDRKSDAFRALRQGMGYCWSVAVVACPEVGKPMIERWLSVQDPDIRWIMKENLKKNRLARLDAAWVERIKRDMG